MFLRVFVSKWKMFSVITLRNKPIRNVVKFFELRILYYIVIHESGLRIHITNVQNWSPKEEENDWTRANRLMSFDFQSQKLTFLRTIPIKYVSIKENSSIFFFFWLTGLQNSFARTTNSIQFFNENNPHTNIWEC